MRNVDLGLLAPCESWKLQSRFFPCKMGGKPAWLDLKSIPSADTLNCEYCSVPCTFLCQIYAPLDDKVEAFHRTLFVFICKNPSCCRSNKNGNLRVLRSQLSRANEFYPYEPPTEKEDWRPDLNAERWTNLCTICGINTRSIGTPSNGPYFCCKEHQLLNEEHGLREAGKSLLFPEFNIYMEEDFLDESSDDEDDDNDSENSEERMESSEKPRNSVEGDEDRNELPDLEDMAKHEEEDDKLYKKFRALTRDFPNQVLRYDRGGEPLSMSAQNLPEVIPKCPNCSSERHFEFQIMPQLLYHSHLKEILENHDWAGIFVYTCKSSCVPKLGYTQEYVWKQDVLKDCRSLEPLAPEDDD